MKKNKPDILEVMNTASKGRQLNALLQNIFERGTEGCEADDELIGLAYNMSTKISAFLENLDKEHDS